MTGDGRACSVAEGLETDVVEELWTTHLTLLVGVPTFEVEIIEDAAST